MTLAVRELDGGRLLEGAPGQPLMGAVADVREVIEACFAEAIYAVLLYPEQLPPQFFDLSSGQAGEILQRLRNYDIRLAIVGTPELRLSSRFGELLADELRGPYFRLFDEQGPAQAWLIASA